MRRAAALEHGNVGLIRLRIRDSSRGMFFHGSLLSRTLRRLSRDSVTNGDNLHGRTHVHRGQSGRGLTLPQNSTWPGVS